MSRHLSGRAALAALVLIIGFASLATAAGGTQRPTPSVVMNFIIALVGLYPSRS